MIELNFYSKALRGYVQAYCNRGDESATVTRMALRGYKLVGEVSA